MQEPRSHFLDETEDRRKEEDPTHCIVVELMNYMGKTMYSTIRQSHNSTISSRS